MKTGQSVQKPEEVVVTNNKFQIRYGITPFEKLDGFFVKKGYTYSYVEVDELTRNSLINAIIENTYTKDAEIALINNELAKSGSSEYKNYQKLRQKAKDIATHILNK